MTEQQQLIRNARNMFQFVLAQKRAGKQQQYTSLDRDAKDGLVLDLVALPDSLPVNPSGSSDVLLPVLNSDPKTWGLAESVMVVPRVRVSRPPALPDLISRFVDGKLDDPKQAPMLKQQLIDVAEGASVDLAVQAALGEVPAQAVIAAFDNYLVRWGAWADEELAAREVRQLYLRLFEAGESARLEPQTWEFVLGLGRLKVPASSDSPAIDRPLLVVPLRVEVSGRSGDLSVGVVLNAKFRLETDMIPPGDFASTAAVEEFEQVLAGASAEAFELDELRDHLRSFVNRGLRDVRLVADAAWAKETDAVVALRPTIIRRKRGDQALVRALDSVIKELESAETLPEGLAAIVDPEFPGASGPDAVVPDGGVVFHNGEPVTPLPLNDRQWDVIQRADSRQLALVQGPPGTGKTHTTAALISHLLAQGKRILVTAAKSEALREVRDKLPKDIRNLAVTRLTGTPDENVQLRGAIEELSRRATEFDRKGNERQIEQLAEEIATLLQERDALIGQLIESRRLESETTSTPFGDVSIPELTRRWVIGRQQYDWAMSVMPEIESPVQEPPFEQVRHLQHELSALASDPRCSEARGLAGDPSQLPSDHAVRMAAETIRRTEQTTAALQGLVDGRLSTVLEQASPETLEELDSAVRQATTTRSALRQRPESWLPAAMSDIALGRTAAWTTRRGDIARRLGEAELLAGKVREHEPIRGAADGTPLALAQACGGVAEWAQRTGDFKVDAAGRPKFSLMTPKAVKHSWSALQGSTLDGRGPRSADDLLVLRDWYLLQERLNDLDHAWPQGTDVTEEDSISERLAWHQDELKVLVQVLELPHVTLRADLVISKIAGMPRIDWSQQQAGQSVLDALSLVAAQRDRDAARSVLDEATALLAKIGPTPVVRRAIAALEQRDANGYAAAIEQLHDLFKLRERLLKADELHVYLRRSLPALAQLLPVDPDSPWAERLAQLDEAWQWRILDSWLQQHRAGEPNAVHRQVFKTEQKIRQSIGEMAALRAWALAVDRLTPARRADLQAYVTLVRQLGKGTGKYAARRMAEIQTVLERAGSSVPVWIMPFTTVIETMSMRPDSFDVVIVDEASQLGIEGLLLAYISPRLVIVGDDKQVSPGLAAGREISLLHPLTEQFLSWNPQRPVYNTYDRSLFDEALMRFPDLITLTEHRRCVPAIIGYSDQIAYRPFNVRLVPVREPGSGALPPFVLTYVEDGRTSGSAGKVVNQREAEVLVEQLVAALEDPKYEGKSFGVISLQGSAQSELIKKLLGTRLPPEVATSIRVGEPPNFQGAERDVIFLSMVAAPNNRPGPMVAEAYVQRFNVAVSRAVDQVHLVHSIRKSDGVLREDDLRYRLLDYIDGLADPISFEPIAPVDSDELDPRFSSRLQQDVFDILVRKHYIVVPDYEAPGGTIDLVVVGEEGKAGLICLDDRWPGADAYRRQLRFEADLLRFGWSLHRVRQTALLVDRERLTETIVEFLEEAGVRPTPIAPLASAADPGSGRSAHQATPRRFWSLIQDSGGVLPALLPDALAQMEPAPDVADCWTTNPGLLPIPPQGGEQYEASHAVAPGSALRWLDGRLLVRLAATGIDLSVEAPSGHLGVIEATAPLRRAVARRQAGTSGDALQEPGRTWRLSVRFSDGSAATVVAIAPDGSRSERASNDVGDLIGRLLQEGVLT